MKKDVRLRGFELDCKYPNIPRSLILMILQKEGYDIEPVRIGTLTYRSSGLSKKFEELLRKRRREDLK